VLSGRPAQPHLGLERAKDRLRVESPVAARSAISPASPASPATALRAFDAMSDSNAGTSEEKPWESAMGGTCQCADKPVIEADPPNLVG
jgi:hypothetical protein